MNEKWGKIYKGDLRQTDVEIAIVVDAVAVDAVAESVVAVVADRPPERDLLKACVAAGNQQIDRINNDKSIKPVSTSVSCTF